jgi:hypothetical protein
MYVTEELVKQRGLPRPAPCEFAGQWIAWTQGRSEIVAHGDNASEVRAAAIETGCNDPWLERVPHPETLFVGRL